MPLIASIVVALALAPVDQKFMETAAQDDIAELKLVRMVVGKTRDPFVKRACKQMIVDHTKHLAEVRALGSRLAIDLPEEPNETQIAKFKHMSQMNGTKLDKSFTADQLEDHIGDINTAHTETEVGQNGEVRLMAKRAIMMYAKHEHIWRGVAVHLHVPSTYGRPTAEQILAGKKID